MQPLRSVTEVVSSGTANNNKTPPNPRGRQPGFAHYAVNVVSETKTLAALLMLVLVLSITEGDATWHEKPVPFFVYVVYGVLMLWGKYVYAASVPFVPNRAEWAERRAPDDAFFDDVYKMMPFLSSKSWALFEHIAIVLWYITFSVLGLWCALSHTNKPDPSSWDSASERLLALALRLQGCGCAIGALYYGIAFFMCPTQNKKQTVY